VIVSLTAGDIPIVVHILLPVLCLREASFSANGREGQAEGEGREEVSGGREHRSIQHSEAYNFEDKLVSPFSYTPRHPDFYHCHSYQQWFVESSLPANGRERQAEGEGGEEGGEEVSD
jgi:hypothetical protein